ncbi:tRNA (guanosine(37)-N1)-methyltransferase TrmD [Schaalia sp. 19OD2882]|uniref:tRNA (guanosine(37)-N1)-methyltransferase TrmD n=1 Tax=Schaalia sp. 19OD2882 TaxID=2794089 RepID=UPI001C1EBE72|nr:tRNA (guanosine(37)-N1)-methyltransferase TrmD [Schaalia sp. 19OD2882]QWW18823.1 tRNA (guanosine(37)-N1)-methyltransferase TrmD [Schaalia sp. 19OD2882]
MRIDLVSIFPDYFAALDLSLMGKAREAGLVDVAVHDLRKWTEDRHRTVDDTPYGGGAGMVMRPDVWGRALDEVLDHPLPAADEGGAPPRRVLAVPTAAGVPLTQRMAEDLTGADQIVVACGRYEGIDQRVTDHYRSREYEVVEYSIGDYVLNGGEVAALVLVEAVVRLLDGVVGNPASVVEESHSAEGLLEHPAYTKPRSWRGLEVPGVLLSGNHRRIQDWRRDRSLVRTAHRRPDMLDRLDPNGLDVHDREILAGAGQVVRPRRARIRIRLARPDEAAAVATLAARTFPAACPPHLPRQAVEDFISENLTEEVFAQLLAEPRDNRILLVHEDLPGATEPIGYTFTALGGAHAMPTEMVRPGKIEMGAAYLSKCYVDEDWRGSGIAGALLERAVADVATRGRNSQVVLGTNVGNGRAIRFYRRHGFKVVSRRKFIVGGVVNLDEVLVRNITATQR